MSARHRNARRHKGFTLTELAIVVVVTGLLLASLLPTISLQVEQRRYSETSRTLQEIREALIGYAAAKIAVDGRPYLPCPDTDNDGLENRSGAVCAANEGRVPWVSLGVVGDDAWNNRIRYRVSSLFANSNAGFALSTEGDLRVCAAEACGAKVADKIPVVLVSHGKNGAGAFNAVGSSNPAPSGADELVNTNTAEQSFVYHTMSPDFDDIVVWLPSALLISRMVAAGRLP